MGEPRPELPLPPAELPLAQGGRLRKQWRYVGVFGEEVMLCAAVVRIGIFDQCFWGLWDRRRGEALEHTRMRPGGREVAFDGSLVEVNHPRLRARLRLGEQVGVETVCRSGASGGWSWTRKAGGVPVTGQIEVDERPPEPLEAFGVDDQSAGFHTRRTAWLWSAGVGITTEGGPIAWNLVEGINDPPENSERSIWVGQGPDAEVIETAPVAFDGLAGVSTAEGDPVHGGEPAPGATVALRFQSETERSRTDNLLLIRSRYRHRFGTFEGSLAGLHLGVMEQHEARW